MPRPLLKAEFQPQTSFSDETSRWSPALDGTSWSLRTNGPDGPACFPLTDRLQIAPYCTGGHMTPPAGPSACLLGPGRATGTLRDSFYRLLQVGDEDADHQRADVDVVHGLAALCGLVNGLLAGGEGGAVVRGAGEAGGRLLLAGGGAPGRRQQARLVPSRHRAERRLAGAARGGVYGRDGDGVGGFTSRRLATADAEKLKRPRTGKSGPLSQTSQLERFASPLTSFSGSPGGWTAAGLLVPLVYWSCWFA